MKIVIAICLCFILQINGSTYPRHTVMFGGYYGGYPWNGRSHPQAGLGYASGDSIATNSFAGENPEQIPEIEETTKRVEEKFDRVPKRKPHTEDEDTDEDSDSFAANWPFENRGRVPSYNAFFPIMLGGGGSGGGGRSGQDQGYYPGSATAIANSFSTGKGGVATSHATSFGDPYMSTLFRNGFKNRKHEE